MHLRVPRIPVFFDPPKSRRSLGQPSATLRIEPILLPTECKSIEPMVLERDGLDVQVMQQFIGKGL